jgi:acyl carrier protein
VFLVLDALPLTPGGKLDRQALPSPDHDGPGRTYVAPRTPIEKRLAEIWEGLFGLGRVSMHDNFFNDLGGHSLLATQLVSRIRDVFEVDLPLQLIFDTPTVAQLAEAIADGTRQAAPAAAPIRPARAVPVDVARLSDEEVDALLEGLIQENKTVR